MIDTVEVVEIPDSKVPNSFDFVAKPKNNSLYKICTKTPQERQDLMNAYNKAKSDLETKKTDKEKGSRSSLLKFLGINSALSAQENVYRDRSFCGGHSKARTMSVEENLKQRELEKQMLKTKLSEVKNQVG